MLVRTEKLLVAAALFNDLDQTRLELLDGGHVLREDTHLSRFGRDVHLHATESCQYAGDCFVRRRASYTS